MTSIYSYELKIPKDRIAVLIGKKGTIKKEIEEATNSKIKVDSKEGDVTISGKDSLGLFSAREIIKAVSRGFNPDIAILLLKQDYVLEVLPLQDFLGKSAKKIIRMKGRVIGQEGKTRKIIEELTETYISIYGKTISIIGLPENVSIARRAIENLLQGSPHSTVYRFLEKQRKKLKSREIFERPEDFIKQ